ncbi:MULTISPECIES: mechanosensitive ion channel domain-containing protein [Prevotella]|uniref:Mechanosensitive ion channel n=1 Tax=Prevotella melaninogenica TaxID=28132 RepID=A0ABX7XQN0_9BACT|nr:MULTISPECIES: mechanosensitive ion channel domain-containing protein [Prevotella]QUB75907.1 mechanosensitive ion channel [Prevotella melaninogenica]
MIPKLPHHLLEDVLEEIRIFVENIIESIGVHGHTVPVLRHVLLALVAILLAFIAERFCKYLFVPLVLRLVKRTQARWDDVVLDHQVLRTACHIVPALVIWQLMPLVFYQYHVVQVALTRLTAVYLTVATARLVTKLIDRLRYLNTKPGDSTSLYLKSFCGVLKILAIFIAVIVVVGILINRSPMTLLAGLGATSAILMLVFKDTIDGLVAGIRLNSNDMIHIGDHITLPGGFVDGTVIDITLTTVKVRQSDNTITTVPPLTLVSGMLQNWKGVQDVDGQRVKRMIYLDVRSIRVADDTLKQQLINKGLATADDLKGEVITSALFRRYLENYLAKREDVNEKMSLLVRQLEATQAGVPMELYFFLRQKDWIPYEHAMADILEHVYAYANEFGLKVYEQTPIQ